MISLGRNICLVLLLVVVCSEANLTNIENEVRQLEDELKKIENHVDTKKDFSDDNFAQSKKELLDAIEAKRENKVTSSAAFKKLESDKRELEKLAFENMLMEDESVTEKREISKEKKEIYDLMSEAMSDSPAEEFDDVEDHSLFCKDQFKECAKAEKKCEGSRKDFMKKFCNGTCGYCKTPAPKPCSESKFGCCWDGVTEKRGPGLRSCPVCYNHYRRLCKEFQPDCLDNNISGKFMRLFCPIACKLCGVPKKACFDSPGLIEKCQVWKENDWCKVRPFLMGQHCRKTCGLCK